MNFKIYEVSQNVQVLSYIISVFYNNKVRYLKFLQNLTKIDVSVKQKTFLAHEHGQHNKQDQLYWSECLKSKTSNLKLLFKKIPIVTFEKEKIVKMFYENKIVESKCNKTQEVKELNFSKV